jgi:hypothetical protein
MKILFLDIDGVLNSRRYDRERDPATQGNIDETRLPLLCRILEETGARIVLSTSWRLYWDPDPARCAPEWAAVGPSLSRFGLEAYDRTPAYNGNNRDREIRDWLEAHRGEVESFAILDDTPYGWGDLADRLVRTDPNRGRGLMESHAERVIGLLQTPWNGGGAAET